MSNGQLVRSLTDLYHRNYRRRICPFDQFQESHQTGAAISLWGQRYTRELDLNHVCCGNAIIMADGWARIFAPRHASALQHWNGQCYARNSHHVHRIDSSSSSSKAKRYLRCSNHDIAPLYFGRFRILEIHFTGTSPPNRARRENEAAAPVSANPVL